VVVGSLVETMSEVSGVVEAVEVEEASGEEDTVIDERGR
jgi:hypothetical protein